MILKSKSVFISLDVDFSQGCKNGFNFHADPLNWTQTERELSTGARFPFAFKLISQKLHSCQNRLEQCDKFVHMVLGSMVYVL